MRTGKAATGEILQRWVPRPVKALFSLRARARFRALFGIDVYPDLAERHPLFGTPSFKVIRKAAAPFDVQKRNKPVLARGYQVLYHLARWFADAAGAAFDACARQLPDRAHSVWNFRPPLDAIFQLTPRSPVRQFVYAYTLDPTLCEALRGYADRVT